MRGANREIRVEIGALDGLAASTDLTFEGRRFAAAVLGYPYSCSQGSLAAKNALAIAVCGAFGSIALRNSSRFSSIMP